MRLGIQPCCLAERKKEKEDLEKSPPPESYVLSLSNSPPTGNVINDPYPQSAFQKCLKVASQVEESGNALSVVREVEQNSPLPLKDSHSTHIKISKNTLKTMGFKATLLEE